MKILYLVHADSKDELSGTPIITQQYIDLAIKKGFEACLLTPSDKKLNNFNQLAKKSQKFSHYYWPLNKNHIQVSFDKENDIYILNSGKFTEPHSSRNLLKDPSTNECFNNFLTYRFKLKGIYLFMFNSRLFKVIV